MSTTIIRPGATIIHDPHAKLVYGVTWVDWLAENAVIEGAAWTLADADPADPEDPLVLEQDNDEIAVDGKSASVRLTGGTAGRKYKVTVHIVTGETPVQEDDRSFYLKVKDR